MLGYVILAAAFFFFALFATAAVSKDPSYKGPAKWFYGIDAAIWQVIFAAVTLVCGFLGSMKHKIPGMLLFALFGGMLIWVAVGKHLTFRIGNLLRRCVLQHEAVALPGSQRHTRCKHRHAHRCHRLP
jgi:hypothetical protein